MVIFKHHSRINKNVDTQAEQTAIYLAVRIRVLLKTPIEFYSFNMAPESLGIQKRPFISSFGQTPKSSASAEAQFLGMQSLPSTIRPMGCNIGCFGVTGFGF